MENAGQAPETVTISVGIAVYRHPGHTSAQLLQAAEQALRDAKTAGRNRVEVPQW